MFDEPRRPYVKRKKTTGKPHSWTDLDQLGLARDYYYHRYIELGHCPRCQGQDFSIHWSMYHKTIPKGWHWRCRNCGQSWREPHITPGMDRGPLSKPDKE